MDHFEPYISVKYLAEERALVLFLHRSPTVTEAIGEVSLVRVYSGNVDWDFVQADLIRQYGFGIHTFDAAKEEVEGYFIDRMNAMAERQQVPAFTGQRKDTFFPL